MQQRTMHSLRALAVSAVLSVCSLLPAWSQGVGPNVYSFVHPFGLCTSTTTRAFGMGGPVSCMNDPGFANPAYAADQPTSDAGIRYSATSFDAGLDLTSVQMHYGQPLRPGISGFQVTAFSLDTGTATLALPGLGAATVDMSERDVSIHYGHRLSPRLLAGVGVSPYMRVQFNVGVPGGPALMNLTSKADIGARLGLAYEWAPDDYLGIVYDYYQETVTAAGLAVGARSEFVFHTDYLALGASRHLRPDLVVAAEFQRGTSSRGDLEDATNGWHFGTEWRPAMLWALRAGLNDSHPTYGVGYEREGWRFDYAYASDWNDDLARPFFGGSSTHQLMATYRW
ncbi:hypothetical protein LLH03_19255 [bacterium]|nr:hypothetical protein [bacterium]